MELRAYRPRQLYYLQKQEKTAKAKATNKMHNKVIIVNEAKQRLSMQRERFYYILC